LLGQNRDAWRAAPRLAMQSRSSKVVVEVKFLNDRLGPSQGERRWSCRRRHALCLFCRTRCIVAQVCRVRGLRPRCREAAARIFEQQLALRVTSMRFSRRGTLAKWCTKPDSPASASTSFDAARLDSLAPRTIAPSLPKRAASGLRRERYHAAPGQGPRPIPTAKTPISSSVTIKQPSERSCDRRAATMGGPKVLNLR